MMSFLHCAALRIGDNGWEYVDNHSREMAPFHSTKGNLEGTEDKRCVAGPQPGWQPGFHHVSTQPTRHEDIRTSLKPAEAKLPPVTRKRHRAYGSGDNVLISVKTEPRNRPCRLFVLGIPAGIPTAGKQEVAGMGDKYPPLPAQIRTKGRW